MFRVNVGTILLEALLEKSLHWVILTKLNLCDKVQVSCRFKIYNMLLVLLLLFVPFNQLMYL
jgi:hypothetical protein